MKIVKLYEVEKVMQADGLPDFILLEHDALFIDGFHFIDFRKTYNRDPLDIGGSKVKLENCYSIEKFCEDLPYFKSKEEAEKKLKELRNQNIKDLEEKKRKIEERLRQ